MSKCGNPTELMLVVTFCPWGVSILWSCVLRVGAAFTLRFGLWVWIFSLLLLLIGKGQVIRGYLVRLAG